MNNAKLCNTCGRPIEHDDLHGLCASCTYGWLVSDIGLAPLPASLSEPPELLNIAGYEIREEIARGGMGIVYRARQKDPQRTVALKMLLPHQVTSPEMVGRFRLEARAIAALEHPAILPVHHVGEHGGLPFFTMKFATGGTLAERKAQFEGNWRAIAELIATLADAVHFAHERGVLHRDLKPGNVLFDEQDRPYVSDFGLAKVAGADSNLTRSVDFLGTPHYVAPEVATRSAREATTSSDVYALGAILYELLAGRPPFDAEGMPALLKKIAEEEPLPPSRRGEWRVSDKEKQSVSPVACEPSSDTRQMPRDLEVICLKCLAKEPPRRYASALDLANDLRRWLAGKPIVARETGTLERLWLWSRRHRFTAALIGVVFGLLIALVAGLSVAAVRIADSRRAALRTVEALESQKINDLLAAGDTAEAIALAAQRVRMDPDNWADTARLMWALQRRRWAVPARAPLRPFERDAGTNVAERTVLVRADDGRLLALYAGTNLVVHDVLARTNRQVWALPFLPGSFAVAEEPGLIVLVSRQGRAHFFDYRTGRLLAPDVAVAGLPNIWLDSRGRRAFLMAPDHSGVLVDIKTGVSRTLTPVRPTSSGALPYFCGYLFPDGQRVAVSDGERTVRILDCESGGVRVTLTARQQVGALAISSDAKVLVTHTADGSQFWDVESGRELPTRPEVGVSFRPGTFRPGGSQFYQGGNRFGLAIFDPLRGELVQMPARGAYLNGHSYADPASRYVAVRFDRFVGMYDGETGQSLGEPLPVATALAGAPRFAEDLCITLVRDGEMIVWQTKTNRLEPVVLRHSAAVQSARFSRDGQRVVTASHDGTARIWDAHTGKALGPPLAHEDKVWSACFSPDGRRVATGSWDTSARLWDTATGEPISPPLRARSYVFHVQFSFDGTRLLACGEDGTVRTYDAKAGRLLLELVEAGPVYWADFSPDGRKIVTRPMFANPKLWNAETGERILELNEPGPRQLSAIGVVTRGEFSRDGSWLALGSPDRYATIWHLPDGKLQAVLSHVAVVRSASLSPDARTILTTADDMTGQLWDLKTGRALSSPLKSPRNPWAPPNTGYSQRAGAIHPDGRRAVTGGSDAAAHLWDMKDGFPLGEPAEFGGSVMHAEFSPDGRRLLLACFDGTAHILPLPPVVERAPAWLAPLAEALAGQRFDSRGAVEAVPPAALWELCEQLRRAPSADEAAVWARKVLDL